jgi:hypothetical protein
MNDCIEDSIEWLRTSLMCELAPEEVQAAQEVSSEALVMWPRIRKIIDQWAKTGLMHRDYHLAEDMLDEIQLILEEGK